MKAQEFIDLYEDYRDQETVKSLINEVYIKDGVDWGTRRNMLKHLDPEKFAQFEEKRKASAAKSRDSKFSALSHEEQQAKIEENLNKKFSRILKDHNIVTATYYYDECKQLAKSFENFNNFQEQCPEAMKDIVMAIKDSGLDDPNKGVKIFADRFLVYGDRKLANAKYSKQRREHREPDEPDVREFKQQKRDAAAKEREEICNQLADIKDPEEFSLKLFDLIHNHNLNHTKPLLNLLAEKIPDNDPRKRFINAAIAHNLKIKYRGKNLEDFDDQKTVEDQPSDDQSSDEE